MADSKAENSLDPEIQVMNTVLTALKKLDEPTQRHVLSYVLGRLGLSLSGEGATREPEIERHVQRSDQHSSKRQEDQKPDGIDDELEGVSPVAKKWITRSGFIFESLSKLFSLGIDEIDLVANKVPGTGKKEKMRNVILLKGAAAYLGSGTARITYDQIKETSQHYGAWDANNAATYLKELGADVSGSRETGYTLTAKGLAGATDLIKSMTTSSGTK